jgi:hypothetical protein
MQQPRVIVVPRALPVQNAQPPSLLSLFFEEFVKTVAQEAAKEVVRQAFTSSAPRRYKRKRSAC